MVSLGPAQCCTGEQQEQEVSLQEKEQQEKELVKVLLHGQELGQETGVIPICVS